MAEHQLGDDLTSSNVKFTSVMAPSARAIQFSAIDQGPVVFDEVNPNLTRIVAPLVYMTNDGEISGCGTAFCVAGVDVTTSIFATAAHSLNKPTGRSSVDSRSNEFPNVLFQDIGPDKRQGDYFVVLPKATDSIEASRSFRFARVEQIAVAEEQPGLDWAPRVPAFSDVALLVVKLDGQTQRPALIQLSMQAPRIGSICTALGYTNIVPGEAISEDQYKWSFSLARSSGNIKELHPSGKGARHNYPHFVTDAYYPFGMSGGPVLDTEIGAVVGVISDSLEHADNDPEIGYIAFVGTLIELVLRLDLPDGSKKPIRFGSIADYAAVSVLDATCNVTRSQGGVSISW